MNCEKYKKLIKKYLDGDIDETGLGVLNKHTDNCSACREEFEHCARMQNIVRESFLPHTSAEQARDSILSKLQLQPGLTSKRMRPVRALLRKQMAVAACILLGIGLLLGFGLGRATSTMQAGVALRAQVPIRVEELEGTVLVKHRGCNDWQALDKKSNIYLGDTFHSAAKSMVSLVLEDKSSVAVGQNSMLVLKLYNGGTQFHLEHGRLTASLNSPHPPFVVSTPHGRVEALGTEFTVTVK